MESFFQCIAPVLECSASAWGTFAKYFLFITSIIGSARLIFKPIQPYLQVLVDKTGVSWDNKLLKWVAFALDYIASIKVKPK